MDLDSVRPHAWLLAATLLQSSTVALAAGFQTESLSAKSQGVRNAGAAAAADSPATVYFNPAGLVYLAGSELEIGFNPVSAEIGFRDSGSRTPFGTPQSGSADGDAGRLAPVPNLYGSHRLSDGLALGLGANIPYGLSTEYESDWTGRYHAIESSVTTLDLHGALAWRATPWLALGAGVDLVYGTIELTNALDLGSLLVAQAGGPVPALGLYPGNQAMDGYSSLEGNDWGLGWNLGLMLDLGPGTRFGVAWRSKVDLDLGGNADIQVPGLVQTLSAGAIRSERVGLSSQVTLPATLRLGLRHDAGERWTLLAGATWTGWHVFDEIRVAFDDGRPDFVEDESWSDVWRFSLGAELRATDNWTLRAGFEYDQSPIPQATLRPRIPEADGRWISIGATWRPAPDSPIALDFGYTRILIGEYGLDVEEQTTPWLSGGALAGNRLVADYDTHADGLSLGLRWRF